MGIYCLYTLPNPLSLCLRWCERGWTPTGCKDFDDALHILFSGLRRTSKSGMENLLGQIYVRQCHRDGTSRYGLVASGNDTEALQESWDILHLLDTTIWCH